MIKTYEFSTKKVVVGIGAVERLGQILVDLNAKKVLVVTDKFMAENGLVYQVTNQIEKVGINFEVFTDVEPSPSEGNAENCYKVLTTGGFDLVIGFGGGSSMDVAKAGAILVNNPPPVKQYIGVGKVAKPGLPIIAIPTTSGTGSESTGVSVLKDGVAHTKAGIASPYLIPDYAVVDPILTVSLPPRLTASTGMDALSHAVEGYTSLKSTPFSDLFHREAIRLIGTSLRTAVNQGEDLTARYNMSLAATLAGIGLAMSGATAAHAMSYPVEGNFKISHGESCAALLPAVAKFNAVAAMEKFKDIAALMGENVEGLTLRDAALKAAEAIKTLAQDVIIPTLGQIGITEKDLDKLAEEAIANKRIMDNNPRIVTVGDVKEMYKESL